MNWKPILKNETEPNFDSETILDGFHRCEFAPLLFAYDGGGEIVYANKSAQKLLCKALKGTSISEVFANFNPFFEDEQYEGKLSIQLPGMHVFGVHAMIKHVGSRFEAVCFVDVEELLMLERRLFQTNQEISNLSRELFRQKSELQRVNKFRNEFVSILSHDLRGPLRRVHSFAEVLELSLESKLDENMRQYLNFIKKESKVMYQMVLDILNFEAIESGKFKLNLENIDIKALIAEVVGGAQSAADEKNMRIDCAYCTETPILHADYVKIRQVVDNLITNCIKYTPKGGVVSIDLRAAGDEIRLTVSDNGPGFTQEEIKTIFEPFRKGLAAGSQSDSFGFGMSIVKKIVESHAGTIQVSNADGGGAKFVIILPAK